jgi:uncharacterized protein (TIGR02271 family)
MTNETIVAVYDTAEHAALAVSDLEAAGISSSAISVHAKDSLTTSAGAAGPVHEKGFWASLFGGEPDQDPSVYDRSVESGSSVVTVKVASEHVEQVVAILQRHGPIDMDDRAASYGYATPTTTTPTTTTAASTATSPAIPSGRTTALPAGEEVVSLSEEQLSVGKRLVNRGTTRIRRFVVETPVEEAVTLHSEHVSIERRPVADGTKVTDAAFTDRVIEVTETEEEAVVAKTARVREEVVVNKAATDRVETVRDTVRREDVEVTQDGQATTTSGTTKPIVPPRV